MPPPTATLLLPLLMALLPHPASPTQPPAPADPSTDVHGRLLEQPRVHCGESRIRVSLRTNDPFGGNVYAKGFFNKDTCRVRGNGVGNTANITIPVNADCGMRRVRMVQPKGLLLEMTVVLMFHPKLLTRNDRAYHIQCRYVETAQRVTHRLDVSQLPTTELAEPTELQSIGAEGSLPKCRYEVLNGGESGNEISFATIGQPVYHRWVCQPATEGQSAGGGQQQQERLYCLTVHTCEVDDGQGNVQRLLDSNG